MPDADMDRAVANVSESLFGCAGQRCLAGSVVVAAGKAYEPFVMGVAIWALNGHHVKDRDGFMTLMARETGAALRLAFVLWVFYLALEPYVRRFWPRTIVSWTRLLTRGPRDPLVARDVLFGMVWGGAVAVVVLATQVLAVMWGEPQPIPAGGFNLRLALSLRYIAAALLNVWFNALVLAMGSLLLLLFLKLRHRMHFRTPLPPARGRRRVRRPHPRASPAVRGGRGLTLARRRARLRDHGALHAPPPARRARRLHHRRGRGEPPAQLPAHLGLRSLDRRGQRSGVGLHSRPDDLRPAHVLGAMNGGGNQ